MTIDHRAFSLPPAAHQASATHRSALSDFLQQIVRQPEEGSLPHVSVVMTFHREGLLAAWMLSGYERVRAHARRQGLAVEWIIVLDQPDEDTMRIVCNHAAVQPSDWIVRTQCADPGTSRNIGVCFAQGEVIGVADGDDYYSEMWITQAWESIQRYGSSVVVHPEYMVSFDRQWVLTRLIDQTEDEFPLAACITTHPWGCAAFAHALIFKTTPYLPTRAHESGFGFEDWHWNLEVMGKGVLHVVAKNTAIYYRRREGSVLQRENMHRAVVRPSIFFDQPQYWKTGFPLIPEYASSAREFPTLCQKRT